MVNLNKIINGIDGKEIDKSFPTEEEIEAKEKETVKNVILNSLASFPVTDKKEIFYVNTIASNILNAENGEIEFSKEHLKFLEGVLWRQTFQEEEREGKKVRSGIYFAPVMFQVLSELGIKE